MLGGCAQPQVSPPPAPPHELACADLPPASFVYYFGPGMSLNQTRPASAGSVAGNGFRQAFVSNDLATWLSAPVQQGFVIEGNVSLDFWVEVSGPLAPPEQSDPSMAYAFLNQFGSDRAFQSGYAKETLPTNSVQGTFHFNETLTLPAGGFTVEKGGRLRALITSLVADAADGPGTHVLFGGNTPSQIRFTAHCAPSIEWQLKRDLRQPVIILANQGGPTHLPGQPCLPALVQEACVNRFDFGFTLENGTQRLRVFLRSPAANSEPKTDADMRLLDGAGKVVYDASTPFVNETMVLWAENLAAFAPPGPYTLRVDLYSGADYSGLLEIAMEHDAADPDA